MQRVESLLLKLEQDREHPDAVNFQKEVQNFTYDELRELSQRLAQIDSPKHPERKNHPRKPGH